MDALSSGSCGLRVQATPVPRACYASGLLTAWARGSGSNTLLNRIQAGSGDLPALTNNVSDAVGRRVEVSSGGDGPPRALRQVHRRSEAVQRAPARQSAKTWQVGLMHSELTLKGPATLSPCVAIKAARVARLPGTDCLRGRGSASTDNPGVSVCTACRAAAAARGGDGHWLVAAADTGSPHTSENGPFSEPCFSVRSTWRGRIGGDMRANVAASPPLSSPAQIKFPIV